MIKEPNAGLTWIFFERDRITIYNFDCVANNLSCIKLVQPSNAPTTLFDLCLRLTLLKWSTIDSRTRGWTLI